MAILQSILTILTKIVKISLAEEYTIVVEDIWFNILVEWVMFRDYLMWNELCLEIIPVDGMS